MPEGRSRFSALRKEWYDTRRYQRSEESAVVGSGAGRNRGEVQSVSRALDLLEALGGRKHGVGVSDLSEALGVPLPTVHRLLATLASRGYARQDPVSRKYTLGSKVVNLGNAANELYVAWVHPFLTELVDIAGETANFAILENDHSVYVAQVPSSHSVRMHREVGSHVLPHCTATGKVLLAFRPRDVGKRILSAHGLPRMTDRTITDPDRFFAELDTVAEQGYALDEGEREVGACCVAVPVFGVGGSLAAMSVSGPSARLDRVTRSRIVPEMLRIAARASQSFMGSAGPQPSHER